MKIENTVCSGDGRQPWNRAALVQALLERGDSKVYAAARREGDLGTLASKTDRRIVPVRGDVRGLSFPTV